MSAGASDRQQDAVDVRGGAAAGVVADAEALVGGAEDDLGGDDEARDADRVDPSSSPPRWSASPGWPATTSWPPARTTSDQLGVMTRLAP
jgi:hypothetical protein